MTALQIILTVPFAVFLIYSILNLFETFKLMLYKGQISEEVRKRQRKRFKIGIIAVIIYFLFAFFTLFINYLLTGDK